LGVGRGTKTFTVKTIFVKKNHTEPRTWTDYLDKRPKGRKVDEDEMGGICSMNGDEEERV
jgi:hypothetical protein